MKGAVSGNGGRTGGREKDAQGGAFGQNSSFSQLCIVQAVLELKASFLSQPQVLGFTSVCHHA